MLRCIYGCVSYLVSCVPTHHLSPIQVLTQSHADPALLKSGWSAEEMMAYAPMPARICNICYVRGPLLRCAPYEEYCTINRVPNHDLPLARNQLSLLFPVCQ